MFDAISNLPPKFLERLNLVVPAEKKIQVYEGLCNHRPPTFRTNTLKTTPQKLQEDLAKKGIETEQVSWFKEAFILKNVPQKELTATDLYNKGHFYVQNLSSMLPPLVLKPQASDKVLDIAAAPGSKTTQMAAMMQNQGEIIANDTSRIRLYKLEANIKTQGITDTKILMMQGQNVWKKYAEYFDKALVDVPCSMEGRFYCDNEKTFNQWSPRKVEELSLRQKSLLRSAISAVKPGGTIVYSTCTLAPEENEGVIDWILKKMDGAVMVEPIYIEGLSFDKPLTAWKKRLYHPQVQNAVRIFPSETMEGFFVAKLRKVRSTLSVSPSKPHTLSFRSRYKKRF